MALREKSDDCTVPADFHRRRARRKATLVTIIPVTATKTGAAETAAETETGSGGLLAALWATARPAQWVKSLVLPLPFVFGGSLTKPRGWVLAAAGVAIFSVVASAIYFVNDVRDRERDAAHPFKRDRPLAAGQLAPPTAVATAILLGVGGLSAAFVLSTGFGRWCALYAGLMVFYSLGLKDVPFLEAFIVAAGLPLRALAGAALAAVPPSPFLMGCAFLLALFLVVGKRQWELQNAGLRSGSEHRAVLASYQTENLDFLFVAIALTAGRGVRGLHGRADHGGESSAGPGWPGRCPGSFWGSRDTCDWSTGTEAVETRPARC